jgi:SAM-dependent methyltransferase
MNPLEHWHEIIFNYRQMIDKHGSTWHGQHAQWYDGWIRQNDYASIIYPLYQPYVKGRVLEIGAGTGLFTAYLVKDAEHVTALDPSADMLYYLLRNVPVLTRLETIQLKIEDFLLPSQGYDFILASHALFNVMEIDQVLCKLMGACPCMGLLIGSGEGLALHTAIKRKFNIKEKKGRANASKLPSGPDRTAL